MKRLVFSLLSSLVLASPAFALVGGPWDNNAFYSRQINGTYQGVIVGKNISGITIFGLTSGSQITDGSASDLMGTYGNAGRGLIFVNGNLVTCNVSAVADIAGRSLTMAIDGSVGFGTTDTAQVVTSSTATTTSGSTGDVKSNVTTITTTYVLDGASQISSVIETGIVSSFPQLQYAGKGDIQVLISTSLEQDVFQTTAPYVDTTSQKYKVRASGVRTSAQSPYILGTLQWFAPSVTTQTTTVTNSAP